MIKMIALSVSLFTLIGCQLINEHKLQINAVEFKNISDQVIENVTLSVISTGGHVSCSVVDANNRCGTGFPTKGYNGEMLSVSWSNQHNNYFEQQFTVQPPTSFDSKTYYKLTLLLSEVRQVEIAVEAIK